MKPAWEWDEEDLRRLIEQKVPEDVVLEYKRSEALSGESRMKDELSKDISAFAHAAGGTLIYGIEESQSTSGGSRIPIKLHGCDASLVSREWLENVIDSNIRPKIPGLRIRAVTLSGEQSGSVAYVVHVPQSHRIHQARDHRFYKRRNFKVEPMEMYEIEDVQRRQEGPLLSVRLELRNSELQFDTNGRASVFLEGFVSNGSSVPAEHAVIRLYFDSMLTPGQRSVYEAGESDGQVRARIGEEEYRLNRWKCEHSVVKQQMPLWEGQPVRFWSKMELQLPKSAAAYPLAWENQLTAHALTTWCIPTCHE